jgi:6-phosphogluconolactonase
VEVIVQPDPESVARAVAERIAGAIREAGERFTIGLSGGTTPIATYEALSGMGLDWSSTDAWVSDERWVPPDHQRSNGRMAEESLIRHVGARFHRPGWSENLAPEESAEHYEAILRSVHNGHRPDLIHLGMGDDGHTASLFPGTTALDETEHWIVANHVPQVGEARITATYPLLWEARLILVQATGAGKAEAVRDSLAGTTPAGRLGEGKGRVEWHLDSEAARLV